MRVTVRMKVAEGFEVPKWYGVSWLLWNERAAICYPIPLNLVLRWLRDVWFWIRFQSPSFQEKVERRMYEMGREAARREQSTRDDAVSIVIKELRRSL